MDVSDVIVFLMDFALGHSAAEWARGKVVFLDICFIVMPIVSV